MCFRFGSCFRTGSGQDYGRSTPKTTHRGGHSNWGSLADLGYYSSVDHKVPLAYHNQNGATDEARSNTYNDGGMWKDHAYVGGDHGGYTPSVEGNADNKASKYPAARHNKVTDDTGQAYTSRLHAAAGAGDRREHAVPDHHRYPTTTTNIATLAR